MNNEMSPSQILRLRGRIWSILRALLFVLVIYFIWSEKTFFAATCVLAALIMGWINTYQLHVQEIEKPYYRVWLNFIDGLLSFAVMTSILIRNWIKNDEMEMMLAVGCVFLLFVLLAILFLLAFYEKETNCKAWFLSKLATIAITLTMGVYLLNLEHYMQP